MGYEQMVLGNVISPRDILKVHPSRKKHPRAWFSNIPEKGPFQKERVVFQSHPFFRGEALVFGGVVF